MWLYWILIILLIIIVMIILLNVAYLRFILTRIPGPFPLPIIGNLYNIPSDSSRLLEYITSQAFKYNGLFCMWLGFKSFVFVSRPDLVKMIAAEPAHSYKSGMYGYIKPWLGNGLLINNPPTWKPRRKLLTPYFHAKLLKIDHYNVMKENTVKFIERFDKMDYNMSFDIYPMVVEFTLDVICKAAMGIDLNSQVYNNTEFVKATNKMSSLTINRMLSPWKWNNIVYNNYITDGIKSKAVIAKLHEFTNRIIEDRKNNKKTVTQNHSLLDVLLESNETDNDVEELSDEDIREEIDTFIFEGHDTTASAISWTIYLLGHHPEIQADLRKEVQTVLGDKICPDHDDLANMPLLKKVIDESLRLFPPVPLIARTLQNDVNMDSYTVKKGTEIVILIWALHRNPTLYENPNKFDPYRSRPTDTYSYIPFSAGERNCIGQHFAKKEEQCLLAAIIKKFNIVSDTNYIPTISPYFVSRPNGIYIKKLDVV